MIICSSDGSILYANHKPDERFQVQIIFSRIGQCEMYDDHVQVAEKVYHLRSTTELFQAVNSDLPERWTTLCGRVPWEQALRMTFGPDFTRLMEQKRACGAVLGSAARIFEAITNAENSISRKTLESLFMYSQDGQGKAFITFAVRRFPELMTLYEQM